MPQEARVDTKSPGYARMALDWPLIDALQSTRAMREARDEFLPQHPKEPAENYLVRWKESWLFGAYTNTVSEFAAAPFRRAVGITKRELLPPQLRQIDRDVDLKGRSVTQFGRWALWHAIHNGVTHFLADFPSVVGNLTAAQEERLGIRPYLAHISARDLWGWRQRPGPGGLPRLDQIRVHEDLEVPDGYGTRRVEEIRVFNFAYEDTRDVRDAVHSGAFDRAGFLRSGAGSDALGQPGTVEVWRKGEEEDEFTLATVRRYTFVGNPLVSVYTRRTGYLTGCPAMLELAEKNAEHFQSESRQTNILSVARVPILARFGVTQEERARGLAVGPFALADFTRPPSEADMRFVEHSGAAIAAGRTRGIDLQEQMEVLKLRARIKAEGDPKATIAAIGETRGQSALESWALDMATALRDGYALMARWVGVEEINDEFAVTIQAENLTLDPSTDRKVEQLMAMREAGDISRATFLAEMKALGRFATEVLVDDELGRLEKEADVAAQRFALGLGPGGGDQQEGGKATEDPTT